MVSNFQQSPLSLQKINLALQTNEECIQKINVEHACDWFNSSQMLCPENHYNGQCSVSNAKHYYLKFILPKKLKKKNAAN